MTKHEHHFSIGVVNVTLRSACRLFVDEYLSLYAPYLRESATPDAIDVEILARHSFPCYRGPYTLRSQGVPDFQVPRRYEVLPHLEWYINWQIINGRSEFVQLHASALEISGQTMILPGDPGSGKSTLTAGLLTRGWSYLCDEFALIDARTGLIHPYPRALCIKEPSFSVIDRLGLTLCRKTPYQKATKGRVAFLNPLDIRSDVVGRPCSVRWVVFPRYVANATPTLHHMARSQAAYELARQCFNFRNDKVNTLDVVADVVRGADCYQLVAGDIDVTCDLMESLSRPVTSRKAG